MTWLAVFGILPQFLLLGFLIREAIGAIRLGRQDFALTEAELLALRSRVTEAILELEAERNG
jgi:hypothetical protein